MEEYLAVDIGASSGRCILGGLCDGKITLTEVNRFPNGAKDRSGTLCWDYDAIFAGIVEGLARCAELGRKPVTMAIDTWGVDFVLLGKDGGVIGPTASYRDKRTEGADKIVYKTVSKGELYRRTGIQTQIFNTIFQLVSLKRERPGDLERAGRMLMVPEYLGYLLTGKMASEYTDCTTTQLINIATGDWDRELIRALGLPEGIFGRIERPGFPVGHLKKEIADKIGFDCEVVLPGSHDTASAVLAVPCAGKDFIYLSSGTWSLIGTELDRPDCSALSCESNFTNEGGVGGTYRHLKNITGLWMIQCLRHELGDPAFSELCDMARGSRCEATVDVSDECFLAPKNMGAAVYDWCAAHGEKPPESAADKAACIYHSLAAGYGRAVRDIEKMAGHGYSEIYIVGGGSKDGYLNELTGAATGCSVYAGPAEATATGNILAQMLRAGVFADIPQARRAVADSFGISKTN
jgi:rhamnulokinase